MITQRRASNVTSGGKDATRLRLAWVVYGSLKSLGCGAICIGRFESCKRIVLSEMRAFATSPCQASTSGRGSCQPRAAGHQIRSCRSRPSTRSPPAHLKVSDDRRPSRDAVVVAAAAVDGEQAVKRRGRPRKDAPPSPLDIDEAPEVVEEGAPGLPKVSSSTPF